MIVDRYDPINLFEMVPKLRLEMEPQLTQLDRLLDDDVLFETVKADLSRRRPNSERLGRRSTPVEVDLTDAGAQEALWMELPTDRALRV